MGKLRASPVIVERFLAEVEARGRLHRESRGQSRKANRCYLLFVPFHLPMPYVSLAVHSCTHRCTFMHSCATKHSRRGAIGNSLEFSMSVSSFSTTACKWTRMRGKEKFALLSTPCLCTRKLASKRATSKKWLACVRIPTPYPAGNMPSLRCR